VIDLQRDSQHPLADQIAKGLLDMIQRGELLEGGRLPSVRQMSGRLGVSVFTVVAAYDKLVARNSIVAKHGSGYFVAHRQRLAELADIEGGMIDPSEALGFAMQSQDPQKLAVRAGAGFLPEEWLADVVPPSLVTKVIKATNPLVAPGPAQGSNGLRRQLAERLRAAGISAVPGQIITTFGASHAFDLLMRTLLRPGDSVVVEDPGYPILHSQLKSHDLRLLPVARLDDGPDLDALEEAVRSHRPKVVFTQTLLHNPTSSSTSAAKCHRLLTLAERYDFDIVEDDVAGDLAPEGATRIAQLDDLRRVYYVSSFSKLLSPTLRVGFMAVPRPAVSRLVSQKVQSVLGSASFSEAIVEAVLETGRFVRHLQQVRARLVRYRQRAHALLAECGVEVEHAVADGTFIWGRLPGLRDADVMVREALEEGVLLAKGSMFSPAGRFTEYMRFNAAHAVDPRLAAVLDHVRAAYCSSAEVRPLRVQAHAPAAAGE
jgi:DNA-binding transcriptional MocR family regulator